MSHAKIEIKITEGCDENGNGGLVVAFPVAVMPAEVWEETKTAWADSTGWTEQVNNPDFDPTQGASDVNPESIPNPISKAWNVTVGWRQRSAVLIASLRERIVRQQAKQQIAANVANQQQTVTVTEGE